MNEEISDQEVIAEKHKTETDELDDAEKAATIGGLGGAAIGAIAGAAAGPVGALVGALAGGLAGAGVSGAAIEVIEHTEHSHAEAQEGSEPETNSAEDNEPFPGPVV